MPSVSHTPGLDSIDDRMMAAVRLVLASSALLIAAIDPSEPDRYAAVTYATLALYTIYSGLCYVLALRRQPLLPSTMTHWVDMGWYVVLVGLSSGTNSIFFFFFFFAILVASFRLGFASGLRVTLTAVALFTVVGFVAAPTGAAFELNRFLLRPLSLLVFGYVVAYWGGSEIGYKRRLALLKDVSTLSNPRFGTDRTLGSIMEQLRAFYNADACLLVVTDQARGQHSLRRAKHRDPRAAGRAEPIPEELAGVLLALPAEQALLYRRPRLWAWWHPAVTVLAGDPAAARDCAAASQVSRVLAAESFISVPFRSRGETVGRLYLTASHRRAFTTSDVDFLLQVLEHTMPVLDNIWLVDQLALNAAAAERQRIAHDLHDSVLQPYLGFQIGVDAIREKLRTAGTDIRDDVERLRRLTDIGIADIRRYMRGLRDGQKQESSLLQVVRRFARTFTETTGIAVHVAVAGDMYLNDRLAAEVFQMVAEGLSNIRRHTISPRATVSLACYKDHLSVRLENDGVVGTPPVPFTPLSITERATALGGRVCVGCTATGSTVVCINIPL